MNLRTVALLIAFALIGIFITLNWALISQNMPLNFGLAQLDAPLGLVLVGMIITLSALFFLYIVYMQANMLLDNRRRDKEMGEQRALADSAEASRFTDLRHYLQEEINKLDRAREDQKLQIMARLDRMETGLSNGQKAIAPVASSFNAPSSPPDNGLGF